MKKIFVLVFAVIFFASACGGQNVSETANPDPVITQPPPDKTTEPDPIPPPTAAPLPEPLEERGLSPGEGMDSPGPWLSYTNGLGIGLVSETRDEVGYLPEFWEYMAFLWAYAPQGNLVAYVQGEQVSEKYLKILSLKDYQMLQTIDLLGYEGFSQSFNNERDAEDFSMDRYFAVGYPVWSSDGSKLAFVSSHLGPSPDVYVYDVATDEITRLTSGPAHAVDLTWSPDAKYIYHAGAEKLWKGYSGSGYSGWTFYAARADGAGVTTTFKSNIDNGHENIIGWYSDNEALMDSGFWFCGNFDLRTVNIENGSRVAIWAEQYSDIAYDPVSKTALVWVSPEAFDSEECGPASESGLYLVSIPDGKREKVDGFDEANLISRMTWDQHASKFVLNMNRPWGWVSTDGEIEMLDGEPFTSPDGKTTALMGYKGKSLQILDSNGNVIKVETNGAVEHPIWSLDSDGLFFFDKGQNSSRPDNLYYAAAPDFNPYPIVKEVMAGPTEWVMP